MWVFKEFAFFFAGLFAITNPVGAVPVFLGVTHGLSKDCKRRVAKRVFITVLVTLVTFALVGQWIFRFFGSTVDAFAIAGGILLFRMALDMLSGQISKVKISEDEEEEITAADMAIIPLGIPLISGPGAITTVMVYMAQASNPLENGIILGVITLISAAVYLTLLSAEGIEKRLGKVGIKVLTRMMGLILASMAVQMVINGIKGAFGL
ncbi:neutral amino acid NAAT transporter SnatA [Palaeococcus ferrophilus]|uniref:neutral amino acid NAAT transporter SnatA n=1 Tax=Palaeococcus ferrophilus TaxID=83868 RepID=UPI00064E783D|nr:neutral amino acid NAAT transporter SnatA [Palaeococcus ferrophilus]